MITSTVDEKCPGRRSRHSARRPFATLALLGLATTPCLAQAPHPPTTPNTRTLAPYTETIPGTNLSLEFLPVPGGTIQIPTPTGTRTVQVPPFWITRTEVPWDVYDVWVFGLDSAPSGTVDAVSGPTKPYVLPGDQFGHQGHPALGMTAYAAERFAQWLSARTGKRYRLPTEAEWRLACQAGSAQAPAPPDLDRIAWFAANSGRRTHPVGTTAPNALGLHDLLGNAAEWVIATDGQPVVMGGAYDDDARDVHCAARKIQTDAWNATDPQLPKSQWWLSDAPFVGLRLVREPDGQSTTPNP